MFQPIRCIARTLLIPAALAAVALASQSAAPGSALANGNYGHPRAAVTASGNYHCPRGVGHDATRANGSWG